MTTTIERWDFFETTFNDEYAGNPFLEVTLQAVFTCGSREIQVNGFYDGNGVFKVRCMPDEEGVWQYKTHSNVPALDGQEGEFVCTPSTGNNHGPVRVANTHHFAYADGTPYRPVGTTCYVWNLQGDALEEQTLNTLERAPFNKMRMSLFPKRYSFNTNEPPSYPFPGEITRIWEPSMMRTARFQDPPDFWDFERFNPVYFQRLEQRILDLRARGIEADLILFHPYDAGAWGFDRMPREVNDRLLHYLVARLGAIRNVWWSFANEYDLFVGRTMEDWDHYIHLVQQIDPYQHLRSIHNCFAFYDHTKPWVTHCSVQHQVTARVPAWREKYNKPVVIDECGYEGDIPHRWGNLSAEEMVIRFWMGFIQGGYVGHGETYLNEEEVLWWSKGGQLRGESVPRIAFLREIFEQAPDLTPTEQFESEEINILSTEDLTSFFSRMRDPLDINPNGFGTTCDAGGYNLEQGHYLFYFGLHQPGSATLNLSPDRHFKVDLVDTWNMTVETAVENASGETRIEMPARKYMALRIQRI
ncbi:MAG: DUF5060 domain-containing protein [Anaerolineae bacterium]|jgi:hypothetical protein|nr:DUF5060 domain-containing protein [Anaerolineae bacterium]